MWQSEQYVHTQTKIFWLNIENCAFQKKVGLKLQDKGTSLLVFPMKKAYNF